MKEDKIKDFKEIMLSKKTINKINSAKNRIKKGKYVSEEDAFKRLGEKIKER